MEIRRSQDRLTSTMGFTILVRQHLYIESLPWISRYSGLHSRYWLKLVEVDGVNIFSAHRVGSYNFQCNTPLVYINHINYSFYEFEIFAVFPIKMWRSAAIIVGVSKITFLIASCQISWWRSVIRKVHKHNFVTFNPITRPQQQV